MDTIKSIKTWFERAVPEPTNKNRAVQIGCHFEEVGEMLGSIGCIDHRIHEDAHFFKKDCSGIHIEDVNRQELLDSLCDQIVTAIGVGHMFGMDVLGALAEVDRSNWSKFVAGQPVFDANRKIAKPVSYTPPDLSQFVG